MQVKKYVASDMQEAVALIKEDLGPRAVILSTRKVRKGTGAFGLFGKFMLEVTAARDETKTPKAKLPAPSKPAPRAGAYEQTDYGLPASAGQPEPPVPSIGGGRNAGLSVIKDDISELKEIVTDIRKGYRRDVNDEANITHLRYELGELKNLVSSLVNQTNDLRDSDLHENLIALYQQLCFNGIEEKFAKRLVLEVQKKIPKEEIENFSYVKVYLARMFMQVLQVETALTKKESKWGPRVLTFLGPTGVGKTTTLAKIASAEKLKNPDLKIGLITIDTFRIAAVQQLKEYAKIINVPCKVVADPEQLEATLQEFRDKDLVLIDSAGRSQRDEMQMNDLREMIGPYSEFTNVLVLSSTTKDSDLIEITKRFSTIPLGACIFTKLDESTSYGSIFNHSIRFKIPLSFLTTGQNVPEDIELASRERLIDLLLNLSGESEPNE